MTGPAHPASARVRLEAALLDAGAPPPAAPPAPAGRTVLVAARDADVRGYVRECLRERGDLSVIEADTVAAARTLAAAHRPALLVVDDHLRSALAACPDCDAVLLVDDAPPDAAPGPARRRLLARPFSAEALGAEVRALIG